MNRLFLSLVVAAAIGGAVLRHVDRPAAAVSQSAAVIVESSEARTSEAGAVYTSKLLADAVKAKGIYLRIVDDQVTGPDVDKIQWALDAAKEVPRPALAMKRGSKIKVLALPKTDKATVDALQKFFP